MATSITNPAWTIPINASSPNDLTKIDKAIQTPGPKQVLVKLTAASLNYRDILISSRSPSYPGHHKESLVPGSGGVGIIHTVGPSSVWAGKEGMPVALHPSNWHSGKLSNLRVDKILGGSGIDGTLQSWIVLDDRRVIEAPNGWSGEQISTLITAGATAWSEIRGGLDDKLDEGIDEWVAGGSKRDWKGSGRLRRGPEV